MIFRYRTQMVRFGRQHHYLLDYLLALHFFFNPCHYKIVKWSHVKDRVFSVPRQRGMNSEKLAMCGTHMSASFNHSKAINTPDDIIYLTLLPDMFLYSTHTIFLILLVIKMKALNTILDINSNCELNCELYIQPHQVGMYHHFNPQWYHLQMVTKNLSLDAYPKIKSHPYGIIFAFFKSYVNSFCGIHMGHVWQNIECCLFLYSSED